VTRPEKTAGALPISQSPGAGAWAVITHHVPFPEIKPVNFTPNQSGNRQEASE
jgi:hypothetical protein